MACLLAPGVPQMVRGDALRVRADPSNFLTNAVGFTEHGSVNLEVASGVAARCASACGTPAAARRPSTRPFVPSSSARADASTTRRFAARAWPVHLPRAGYAHGGRIGMESDGRTGSRFWVELPLPALDPAATEPLARASATRWPVKRVLVAEDNPVNMVIITSMLQTPRRRGAAGPRTAPSRTWPASRPRASTPC